MTERATGVAVSVVVPVFRNAPTLEPLVGRIGAVLTAAGFTFEVLLVDDASDDASPEVMARLVRTNSRVRGFRLARNQGQHLAVMLGLQQSQGVFCVVLDADLQDPPEAMPELLGRLSREPVEVVFAARTGRYQGPVRMLTSWLYRRLLLRPLAGLPQGAGMYFALRREAFVRLLSLSLPARPMTLGLIAAGRLKCAHLPVARAYRLHGRSAYSASARLLSAGRMLACALRAGRGVGPTLAQRLAAVPFVEDRAGRHDFPACGTSTGAE